MLDKNDTLAHNSNKQFIYLNFFFSKLQLFVEVRVVKV